MIDPFASRTTKPLQFQPGDKVILCEGLDDCAVVSRLTSRWNKKPVIGTRDSGAGLSWSDEFNALAKQIPIRRLAAIGFVFDAESSRSKTESELEARYKAAGLAKPMRPGVLKISVIDRKRIKTGYLINPSGKKTGGLESLFLPQIKASKQWRCIHRLLECYKAECPIKRERHESKVAMRTFIAHGNAYNTGLKVALQDGLLNCDGPEFDPLRKFLSLIEAV